MLNLPRVTLVAFGSTNIEGMKKALKVSQNGIKFGAVKLITQECNSIDEWNRAIVYDLGDYIDTDFALLIHPDGYVVNPESWTDDFMRYDYIGSPWPSPTDDFSYKDIHGIVQRVGNSVSLRSKKLMQLPKKINMEWRAFHGNTNEDGAICVNYRHIFQGRGCKFAPFELAVKFGREKPLLENQGINPFVFHRNEGENSIYPIFE